MDSATRKSILDKAAAALATDPAVAEREARRLLDNAFGDPNAILILSSALRRQGRAPEAIAALQPLLRTYPKAHVSHYEHGMALADAGQTERAIEALQTATQLDPDYVDAWRALGALLFDAGDARGADAAFDQHHRANVRDPRLKSAAEALYGGRPADAITLLRPIVSDDRDDVVAMGLLAEAYARRNGHADAVALLKRVLERAPEDERSRFRLARALHHEQQAAEALAHLEQLIAADAENPAYRSLMAGVLVQIGEFDRAMALYEGAVGDYPAHAPTWVNYGHALRMVGRTDDAIAAYRRGLALDRGFGEAYLGLANLKVATFTEEEVGAMRRLVDREDLSAVDRQLAGFALGQALEDEADYEGSFEAYSRASALRRRQTPFSSDVFTRHVRHITQVLTADFFAERADFGSDAPDPIFIVGLPRSGSTLIEQILASHSQVEGAAELPDIGAIAARLGAYPDALTSVSRERSVSLGDGYLESTRIQRKLGRPFFIDKMPNNFEFVGLIQLILPKAKIIDARRDPMATGFSAFKQYFAQGQAFSYNLGDVGRYYRDYVVLMAHYDVVLPGRVHRVIYEDLVEDTEAEVRRLLDYCGLAFEPGCLAFHQNARAVRTPSSEQVRRPIFREGLEQWRNYEPWLEPLKDGLGSAATTWRKR